METIQSTQTCICGLTMTFPEGEVRATCSCERVWEISTGGIWFTNLNIAFPSEAQEKVLARARVRNKRKRKAGIGCLRNSVK